MSKDIAKGIATLVREGQEARADATRLRQALTEALASFTRQTHPGRACLQTDHIPVEVVAKWRAALGATTEEHT